MDRLRTPFRSSPPPPCGRILHGLQGSAVTSAPVPSPFSSTASSRARHRIATALVSAALSVGCATSARADARPPVVSPSDEGVSLLGTWPLCEASAALVAPWDPSVVLVADNEVHSEIFAFSAEEGGRLTGQRSVALPPGAPRDIEALASVGDSVLVVGSFSRNKRCEVKRKRQRMMVVQWREGRLEATRSVDGAAALNEAARSVSSCLSRLFGSERIPGAREVCAALVGAEKAAQAGTSCDTMDVEGAVAVDGERVWLGLRRPLSEGRAILLRLAPPLESFRFDRVALVDLQGRGVRELTREGDRIWGIAGPTADSREPFRLFSFPAAELGQQLRPTVRLDPRLLPTSSEGLVLAADRLTVVIDGDEGTEGMCRQPSGQASIPR